LAAFVSGAFSKSPTTEIFNVFDTGKMSFQGKQTTALAKEIRAQHEGAGGEAALPQPAMVLAAPATSPVFIVYGHDVDSRNQLELILHRMRLEPIILGNLAAAGDTIIEKWSGIWGTTAMSGSHACG
jgi:predicted nucleotide-binding protein